MLRMPPRLKRRSYSLRVGGDDGFWVDLTEYTLPPGHKEYEIVIGEDRNAYYVSEDMLHDLIVTLQSIESQIGNWKHE